MAAYKKDVDRTLLRFLKAMELARFADELRRAGQTVARR